MKRFSLRSLTSLGLAMSLIATMSGCARNFSSKGLPTESNNTTIEDTLVDEEKVSRPEDIFNVLADSTNERNYIYDESGAFSHPLSYYSFKSFPKVNRTDVDLMSFLAAYGMSYEDFINIFVRGIYADKGNLSYEESFALTTVRLNRLIYRDGFWGDTILDIYTKGNQFGSYVDGSYTLFDIEGLENCAGYQGIVDCLVNFAEDQTNRMHDCMSFRWNEIEYYSDYTFTEGGSRFGMPLQASDITYKDFSLNDSMGR